MNVAIFKLDFYVLFSSMFHFEFQGFLAQFYCFLVKKTKHVFEAWRTIDKSGMVRRCTKVRLLFNTALPSVYSFRRPVEEKEKLVKRGETGQHSAQGSLTVWLSCLILGVWQVQFFLYICVVVVFAPSWQEKAFLKSQFWPFEPLYGQAGRLHR